MLDPKPPVLMIGGIPIDSQSFSWAMLSGTHPNREQFEVSRTVSDKIKALKNPVDVLFDFHIGRGDKLEQYTARFQNLYLIEKKTDMYFQDIWEIADSRMLWEGRKVSRMYNIQWGGYSQVSLRPKLNSQFSDFTVVQNIRYAKWSLKKWERAEFLVPTNDTYTNGLVWTAKEVAIDLLRNVLGIKDFIDNLPDNGFQPENLIFDMVDIQSALQEALQKAHGNICQDPDGRIRLFRLDEPDATITGMLQDFGIVEGSEIPFTQDLSRIRPGNIEVYFEKEYEILFKYSEQALSPGVSGHVIGGVPGLDLENILQLPDTFTSAGKTYVVGSWMNIWEAIQLWNLDTKSPPPSGKALTKTEILRRWCVENYLENLYGTYILKGIPRADEVWMNRIASLRANFRKTFRVVPYWAQRLREVRADRATKLDPITGRREPSPVFMNYTSIATYRQLMKSQDPSAHVSAKIISLYPANEQFAKATPTPFYVRMMDERLGIFQIDYLFDPQFFTMRALPGEVDPVPKVAAGLSQDLILWGRVSLKPDFKLATILSCIFAVPNSIDSKLGYGFPQKNGNEKKVVQVYSTQENARFEYGDNMSVYFNDKEGLIVAGATLSNGNVIEGVASAEAAQIEFSWKDRSHVGSFVSPGWRSNWKPVGWIQSVAVQFESTLGLSTLISMPEPPAAIPMLSMLSPAVRHILQKNVISREGI